MSDYDDVKNYYASNLQIKPKYVDIMADLEILRLCACGLANKSISRVLDLDTSEIEKIIHKHLKFYGWLEDLDINPLVLYQKVSRNKLKFVEEYVLITGDASRYSIRVVYEVVDKYREIDEDIKRHWK